MLYDYLLEISGEVKGRTRSPPTAQPTSRLAVCFVGILAFVLIKRASEMPDLSFKLAVVSQVSKAVTFTYVNDRHLLSPSKSL
ncbi:hypothetical protein WN943_009156 [Citrus x changshan-huyou]